MTAFKRTFTDDPERPPAPASGGNSSRGFLYTCLLLLLAVLSLFPRFPAHKPKRRVAPGTPDRDCQGLANDPMHEIHSPKDWWDKFQILAPLLTGIVIAFPIFLLTHCYEQRESEKRAEYEQRESERQDYLRQEELRQLGLQVVGGMLANLARDESSKKQTLLTFALHGRMDLATSFAALEPTEGALSAMAAILAFADQNPSTSGEVAEAARDFLDRHFGHYSDAAVQITLDEDLPREGLIISTNGLAVIPEPLSFLEPCEEKAVEVKMSDARPVPGRIICDSSKLGLKMVKIDDDQIKTLPPMRTDPPVRLHDMLIGLSYRERNSTSPRVGIVERIVENTLQMRFFGAGAYPSVLVDFNENTAGVLHKIDFDARRVDYLRGDRLAEW